MNYELEEVTTSNGHRIRGFKDDYITKKSKNRACTKN
jgi:hypothetical protein